MSLIHTNHDRRQLGLDPPYLICAKFSPFSCPSMSCPDIFPYLGLLFFSGRMVMQERSESMSVHLMDHASPGRAAVSLMH